MPRVEGIEAVQKALSAEIRVKLGLGNKQPSAIAGYTAAYAIHVHENVEMKLKGVPRSTWDKTKKGVFWGPNGQAKFLEQPARELGPELARIIRTAVKNGAPLGAGLLMAALRLLRESQEKVPIDTGNLKNSGFARKE